MQLRKQVNIDKELNLLKSYLENEVDCIRKENKMIEKMGYLSTKIESVSSWDEEYKLTVQIVPKFDNLEAVTKITLNHEWEVICELGEYDEKHKILTMYAPNKNNKIKKVKIPLYIYMFFIVKNTVAPCSRFWAAQSVGYKIDMTDDELTEYSEEYLHWIESLDKDAVLHKENYLNSRNHLLGKIEVVKNYINERGNKCLSISYASDSYSKPMVRIVEGIIAGGMLEKEIIYDIYLGEENLNVRVENHEYLNVYLPYIDMPFSFFDEYLPTLMIDEAETTRVKTNNWLIYDKKYYHLNHILIQNQEDALCETPNYLALQLLIKTIADSEGNNSLDILNVKTLAGSMFSCEIGKNEILYKIIVFNEIYGTITYEIKKRKDATYTLSIWLKDDVWDVYTLERLVKEVILLKYQNE